MMVMTMGGGSGRLWPPHEDKLGSLDYGDPPFNLIRTAWFSYFWSYYWHQHQHQKGLWLLVSALCFFHLPSFPVSSCGHYRHSRCEELTLHVILLFCNTNQNPCDGACGSVPIWFGLLSHIGAWKLYTKVSTCSQCQLSWRSDRE